MKTTKQITKLATMLGLGGMNGTISIAALAGLFTLENAFVNSILFIAGPGAILTAIFLDGNSKERMFSALISGIIATIIVIFAAGLGVKVLSFFNLDFLKIFGGIAILSIGLIIMGLKLNENIPLVIIVLGIVTSAIWRN